MKASKVPDIVYFSHHNSFVEVSNFKKNKKYIKIFKKQCIDSVDGKECHKSHLYDHMCILFSPFKYASLE